MSSLQPQQQQRHRSMSPGLFDDSQTIPQVCHSASQSQSMDVDVMDMDSSSYDQQPASTTNQISTHPQPAVHPSQPVFKQPVKRFQKQAVNYKAGTWINAKRQINLTQADSDASCIDVEQKHPHQQEDTGEGHQPVPPIANTTKHHHINEVARIEMEMAHVERSTASSNVPQDESSFCITPPCFVDVATTNHDIPSEEVQQPAVHHVDTTFASDQQQQPAMADIHPVVQPSVHAYNTTLSQFDSSQFPLPSQPAASTQYSPVNTCTTNNTQASISAFKTTNKKQDPTSMYADLSSIDRHWSKCRPMKYEDQKTYALLYRKYNTLLSNADTRSATLNKLKIVDFTMVCNSLSAC